MSIRKLIEICLGKFRDFRKIDLLFSGKIDAVYTLTLKPPLLS